MVGIDSNFHSITLSKELFLQSRFYKILAALDVWCCTITLGYNSAYSIQPKSLFDGLLNEKN